MLSASDVAFRFSPRLNAAGRMGDQTLSLLLLRSGDLNQARALAARLERVNQERRQVEQRVSGEAVAQVLEVYGDNPRTAVVAAGQGWHPGVVGICASRLAERFGVPSVVIALEGETGRGSARTSKGFALYDALEHCSRLLQGFGGHQAAAGVTIAASQVEAFRSALADASRPFFAALAAEGERKAPLVDVALGDGAFDLPPASDLSLLEPAGEGNAEPVFLVPDARVEDRSVVGAGADHLKLSLRIGGQRLSAFGFQLGARAEEVGGRICALGSLRPDTWKGGENVELWLADFE